MRAVRITFVPLLASFCLFLFRAEVRPAWSDMDNNQSCRECHLPHPARVTHEIHARVECESCHLEKGDIYPGPDSGRIRFKKNQDWETGEDVHDNLKDVSDKQSCRECHFKGNEFGASATVLPPKSFLCLPCHTATFSAGHPLTIVALIIFGAGLLGLFFVWKRSSGHVEIRNRKQIHPLVKVFVFTRSLFAALFINQRLFKQSPGRWLIHGLMIYPLITRFLWGLTALLGSLYAPQSNIIRPMLDRDHPATAFFFDLTGILILSGFLFVLFRHGIRQKSLLSDKLNGLPGADWPGFLLFGALIISGFLQEALRFAMSVHGGTPYAFAGYYLSRMMNGTADLTLTYVYFWYAHFILTAGLVAYLPFSRFKHLIMGPISLAIQSVHEQRLKDKGQRIKVRG